MPSMRLRDDNIGSPGRYFLFGRGVSADAVAVLAALPLLGLRSAFPAALAAFLLVTSALEPGFGIILPS